MNNQMDKAKFLEWLDGEDAAVLWEGPEGLMKYDMLVETINSGEFAPDTPPVPTIKPGDKVRITDALNITCIGKEDIVTQISSSTPYSARLENFLGDWPFSSLEVVE
ncbi:hypothetical protein OHJ21_19310 [Virgibacillus sp. LDC1]|nr:hypothetical protein [Virgibacillus sp. LDC1]